MNKVKLQGLGKFFAFLLIAVLVISIIVFAVNGNEPTYTPQNGQLILNTTTALSNTSKAPENMPDEPENDEESTNNDKTDDSVNVMTGLPVSQGASTTAFGIVIDPKKPSYGLSYADIAIEFPTEGDDCRMLFYLSGDDTIWKIGSLAPTRGYINDASALIGGVLFSYGNDDKIPYAPTITINKKIDISPYKDCYYSENERYIYTNSTMLKSQLTSSEHRECTNGYNKSPFVFSQGNYDDGIEGANSISIPYTESNTTTLVYNSKTERYQYIKCAEMKYDLLCGEIVTFSNAFILFANSTTYENADASQLVINTTAGGRGYYFSKGKYTEIIWENNDEGLIFKDLSGEVLCINTGNSYITYYKASQSESITIN